MAWYRKVSQFWIYLPARNVYILRKKLINSKVFYVQCKEPAYTSSETYRGWRFFTIHSYKHHRSLLIQIKNNYSIHLVFQINKKIPTKIISYKVDSNSCDKIPRQRRNFMPRVFKKLKLQFFNIQGHMIQANSCDFSIKTIDPHEALYTFCIFLISAL